METSYGARAASLASRGGRAGLSWREFSGWDAGEFGDLPMREIERIYTAPGAFDAALAETMESA